MSELLHLAAQSPWYTLIGMKPKLVGDEVHVELSVEPEKHHQALGTAHGGVIASLLDSAIGLSINRVLFPDGKAAVTVQLNIHYMKPAIKGKLTAKGRILNLGTRIAVGYGEVWSDGGELIAAAIATFYIVER